MPKISEILGGLTFAEIVRDATLIQAANVLKCDVAKVRELFAQNGTGMIYTPGLIMADTPRNRAKLTALYGEIVILFADGTAFCRTKVNTGQINRHKRKETIKRERDMAMRERKARQSQKATLRLFEDAQTRPMPKRSGKANSHADIGKYVNRRGITPWREMRQNSVDVCVPIHINYNVLC